jgi:hypothetical protein
MFSDVETDPNLKALRMGGHHLDQTYRRRLVVAGEQLPADLEGDEGVDAGVLDLLLR